MQQHHAVPAVGAVAVRAAPVVLLVRVAARPGALAPGPRGLDYLGHQVSNFVNNQPDWIFIVRAPIHPFFVRQVGQQLEDSVGNTGRSVSGRFDVF